METVSFICVVYNHSLELVQRMIDSVDCAMLYRKEFKYDFIIVDNSEEAGLYCTLRSHTDNIRNVRSDTNSGYCGGNNLGIRHSESTYIIIINPDIIIENSLCIDWMVGSAKLNNSIAGWMIGTNEWYTYSATFPTEVKYESSQLPFYPTEPTLNKPGRWKSFRYIDGSLMCFPRNLALDIGGFDEAIFPGYFGENAFCFEAFLAGYEMTNSHTKNMYAHRHGQRSSDEEAKIYAWSKIGRELFYAKYALPNWDKFIEYMNK